MADLSIIYSKTGKGLRARNAANADLSTQQLKLLAFINGKSKADEILNQSDTFTEKELAASLSQLETNGFIRPLAAAQSTVEDWGLTSNFTPMVVEEFKNEDEIEAKALAKAATKVAQEKQDAERIAAEKANEKIRWMAEINARKEAEAKHKAEEKSKVAAKEKARLAQERLVREAAQAKKNKDEEQKKQDDETRAKADAKARIQTDEKARLKAQLLAKAENEAQLEAMRKAKAELKAQQAAEQTRLEIERLEKIKQAQLEAERIAKAENDAQLETARKAKAELILQQELQQKAQQKAERAKLAAEQARTIKAEKETADAATKEAARLEMTRIVRKAEEERKQVESQLKEAWLEAKRQFKAKEHARAKAARKAKDDAAQALVDATAVTQKKAALLEAVQIEMNRFTRDAKSEKNIVDTAENNAKALLIPEALQIVDKIAKRPSLKLADLQALEKAEQIRANNEADEKAALAEKELARQEIARIAREADALRSQTNNPTLTIPTKSGRFEASNSMQLKSAKLKQSTQESQLKVTEKNAKNLADARAREAEKRAYVALTEKQSAAKYQAEIEAPTKTMRTLIDLISIVLNCVKWLAKLLKTTLIVDFILAFLLIGVLHFVNISPLIAPIEKLATNNLGSPVHIEQVRASLWPQPHFTLGNVAIGDVLKVTSIQVIPDASTLFKDVRRVKMLQIHGLMIEHNNVEQSLNVIAQIGKAPSLKIEQLNVSDLSFKAKDLVLGPFDGNLTLNAASELTSLDLHHVNQSLTAQIKRLGADQGEDYAITLTGNHWPLPLNPNIVFDELKAKASLHQNQMTFSQIEGAIFGGNISAQAVLDWSNGWHTMGNFTLTSANAPQLLSAFASKASVEGKVSLAGDFASQSIQALKLADEPSISANVALKNGKINGVDLTRAVLFSQNASLAGEATAFDTLSAHLQVNGGQYHYKQIALNTKQFHANGNVNIDQNRSLTGRANASLAVQSRRLQANFGLSGTINNVKRQ